jgi:LPS O-antigen subunit length determinant protein (WzzB/FepE family)
LPQEPEILDYASKQPAKKKLRKGWSPEKLILAVLGTIVGLLLAYFLVCCLLAEMGVLDPAG